MHLSKPSRDSDDPVSGRGFPTSQQIVAASFEAFLYDLYCFRFLSLECLFFLPITYESYSMIDCIQPNHASIASLSVHL